MKARRFLVSPGYRSLVPARLLLHGVGLPDFEPRIPESLHHLGGTRWLHEAGLEQLHRVPYLHPALREEALVDFQGVLGGLGGEVAGLV